MPDLRVFLISGLGIGAVYVLSGVGLVVLFRASGTLNLAQGALGALGALVAWQIVDYGGSNVVAWSTGIAVATLMSAIYGRFLAPRLAHSDPVIRAVATLAFALILLGAMSFVWGETPRRLRLPIDTLGFSLFDVRVTYPRVLALIIAIVATVAIDQFLKRTRLGLDMRALANSRELSALLGVNVLRADTWAWVISGALAGISGLMLANLTRLSAQALTFLIVPVMAAAVVGRLSSLGVTVVAGLVIGVCEALLTPFPDIAIYRSAVPFLFAALALLWMQRQASFFVQPMLSIGGGQRKPAQATRADAPAGSTMVSLAVTAVIAGLALVALPSVLSGYWLKTSTSVVAVALGCLSVGLLYARLGMISLCQFALLGVGGWFTLRLAFATALPFELTLLGGGAAAALFGVAAGLPALRMRGLHLAIITLMVAGALQVILSSTGFPNGGPGLLGMVVTGSRQLVRRPDIAVSDIAYFRYSIIVAIACFLLVEWHVRSRAGRAWALIRRSEATALAAGVNIIAYKVWAFALAGFVAGIGGGLLAGGVGQLDGLAFTASESIMLFALSVIAGTYSWVGPLIGGILARAVPALLNEWNLNGNLATIVFGAGLLHALTQAPGGVSAQIAVFVRSARGSLLNAFKRARTAQ